MNQHNKNKGGTWGKDLFIEIRATLIKIPVCEPETLWLPCTFPLFQMGSSHCPAFQKFRGRDVRPTHPPEACGAGSCGGSVISVPSPQLLWLSSSLLPAACKLRITAEVQKAEVTEVSCGAQSREE